MSADFDVLGLGNAIMDIIAPVSDAVLEDMGIAKGAMTLIDMDTALSRHKVLEEQGGDLHELAGGSAANTLAGIAGLDMRAAYIGKTADDETGRRFVTGMKEAGVHFETRPLEGGEASARCLIAVTPDGERSMSTYLGASVMFSEDDIVRDLIERSRIVYMEGYLFDRDDAKAAFRQAAAIAAEAGRETALTLSDPFCVDRHREDFKDLLAGHIDIVFANEAELLSLYETDDFEAALETVSGHCRIACVTRSAKGSVIVADGVRTDVTAEAVDAVVDTTGAGDQYAAGVLAGYAAGLSWAEAGRLGSICAAEVISHYGPRPDRKINLKEACA